MLTSRAIANSKKIKYGGLGVAILCLTPPSLIISAGVILNKDPIGNQIIAKVLTYGSFGLIFLSALLFLVLLITQKLGRLTASVGIFVCLGYATLPLAYAAKSFKEYQQDRPKSVKTLLNFFNPNAPHYAMGQTTINELLKATSSLNKGEYYISVLHKLPPVPDGCPIIMRTLTTKEIVLSYFIEKKYEGSKSHPSDKHITMIFDKNQNLVETRKIM